MLFTSKRQAWNVIEVPTEVMFEACKRFGWFVAVVDVVTTLVQLFNTQVDCTVLWVHRSFNGLNVFAFSVALHFLGFKRWEWFSKHAMRSFFVDAPAVSWKSCKADRHRLQFCLLCSNLLSSSEGLQHGDAWRWSPMKYYCLARGMWAIAMACVVWKVQRIQLTMLYWFVDLLCWWRVVDSHTNWQQVRSNYNQLQHEGFCSQSGEALTLGCACLRKERVQNIWCWSVGFWLHWMTQAKKYWYVCTS